MTATEYFTAFASPIGNVCVRANERGITEIGFADDAAPSSNDIPEHLRMCSEQLQQYFAGTRRTFDDFPLVLAATDWEELVWDAAMEIPYGETRGYGELAKSIGSADAARAVGMALNRNPVAIVIPCHRIVAADGAMTGYAGGVWRKEWLLRHEKE